MSEKYYERYCAFEEQLEKDQEMRDLKKQLEEETKALIDVISRLSEEDRGVIHEIISILGEIQERTIELAALGFE